MQTMWSRTIASDSSVGPNKDRHTVPEVLDNTAVRPREPRLSGEEARRQLNTIAYDLCNMGRLLETVREDQEVVTGEFQGTTGEDRKTSGETGRYYWLLLTERQ